MTVDAFASAAGGPPPPAPRPTNRDRRSFPRRHPWLTALYSLLGLIGLLILALIIFLWLAN